MKHPALIPSLSNKATGIEEINLLSEVLIEDLTSSAKM
jgi:hypothetical protein